MSKDNQYLLSIEAIIAFQRLHYCLESLDDDNPITKMVCNPDNPLMLEDHVHNFNIEQINRYFRK